MALKFKNRNLPIYVKEALEAWILLKNYQKNFAVLKNAEYGFYLACEGVNVGHPAFLEFEKVVTDAKDMKKRSAEHNKRMKAK